MSFEIRSRFNFKGAKWTPWCPCNGPGFQKLVVQAEQLLDDIEVVTLKSKRQGTFQIRRSHNALDSEPIQGSPNGDRS